MIDFPELGQLTWRLWELTLGAENNVETDVRGDKLIENIGMGIERVPDNDDLSEDNELGFPL